ncbi:MAG: glycosyltransferase [Acidimicrobiia bacterium]
MTVAVVSGALANKPGNGGNAWTRMCWVVGLRRLGFDVYFVEELPRPDDRSSTCEREGPAGSEGAEWFRSVTSQFGLAGRTSLMFEDGGAIVGLRADELREVAEGAMLVNIGGHLTNASVLRRFRRRAYYDDDPGYTQLWAVSGNLGSRLQGHDVHFTVGGNIGAADCTVPTAGLAWHPMAPPVVLESWPAAGPVAFDRFTTVGSWRGPYGPVTAGGTTYGSKAHEFRRFMALPELVPERFELALDIHPADHADRERLARSGWHLVDPASASSDPDRFRSYLRGSGAEFSAAQEIYVRTKCGWFSDRTARYLASGRPALVQDTGFSRTYPVGEGLLVFRSVEEAVAGVRAVVDDYERHCRAARSLAEELFDSDRVLGRFVELTGVTP